MRKPKRKLGSLLLLAALGLAGPAQADSQPFASEDLTRYQQQYQGKQWLLLLWSVDCPPCFKELAVLSRLATQQPELRVVLVNTDDDDQLTRERQQIVAKYGLEHLPNFHFADGQGSHSRYRIDPTWYGELPRSYFFEADGTRHGRSGLVTAELLERWLTKQPG